MVTISKRDLLLLKLSFAGLAISWAMLAYSNQQLINLSRKQREHYKSLYNQTQYLLARLEQEGINLSEVLGEFDLIAFKNMEPPEDL